MSLDQAVFLNCKNHGNAIQALTKATKDIKEQKTSIFIFLKGTRVRLQKVDLLSFKKEAFHMTI